MRAPVLALSRDGVIVWDRSDSGLISDTLMVVHGRSDGAVRGVHASHDHWNVMLGELARALRQPPPIERIGKVTTVVTLTHPGQTGEGWWATQDGWDQVRVAWPMQAAQVGLGVVAFTTALREVPAELFRYLVYPHATDESRVWVYDQRTNERWALTRSAALQLD